MFCTVVCGPILYFLPKFERNLRGRNFFELLPIGPHVTWISIWPLEVKPLHAQAKYFVEKCVVLYPTVCRNLSEIWVVTIFRTFAHRAPILFEYQSDIWRSNCLITRKSILYSSVWYYTLLFAEICAKSKGSIIWSFDWTIECWNKVGTVSYLFRYDGTWFR